MTDNEIIKTLNNLFPKTIKTFGILKFDLSEPISNNVNDTTSKAILKYCKHPNISKINEKCKIHLRFSFSHATLEDSYKDVRKFSYFEKIISKY